MDYFVTQIGDEPEFFADESRRIKQARPHAEDEM